MSLYVRKERSGGVTVGRLTCDSTMRLKRDITRTKYDVWSEATSVPTIPGRRCYHGWDICARLQCNDRIGSRGALCRLGAKADSHWRLLAMEHHPLCQVCGNELTEREHKRNTTRYWCCRNCRGKRYDNWVRRHRKENSLKLRAAARSALESKIAKMLHGKPEAIVSAVRRTSSK